MTSRSPFSDSSLKQGQVTGWYWRSLAVARVLLQPGGGRKAPDIHSPWTTTVQGRTPATVARTALVHSFQHLDDRPRGAAEQLSAIYRAGTMPARKLVRKYLL